MAQSAESSMPRSREEVTAVQRPDKGEPTEFMETLDYRLAPPPKFEEGGSIAQLVRNENYEQNKRGKSKDGHHTLVKTLEERIAKKMASVLSQMHLLSQPNNSSNDESSAKDHQGISTKSVETPDDGLAKKIMSEKGGSIAQLDRNDDSKRKKGGKSKDGQHTPGNILEERVAKKMASEPSLMSRMHLLRQPRNSNSDDNSAKDQNGRSTSSVETPDDRLAKKK